MAKMNAVTLTDKEQIVLDALKENAEEWSGGDFALVGEMCPLDLGLHVVQELRAMQVEEPDCEKA